MYPTGPTVPHVRQQTKYTCGPASLLAILKKFKADDGCTEAEIAKIMDCTEKDGASPEQIVGTAEAFGVAAQKIEPLTVGGLVTLLQNGCPVIINYQDHRDDPTKDWRFDQADGHYAVAMTVNHMGIQVMDPSIEGKDKTITFDDLEKRWHDKGKLGPTNHLGIAFAPPEMKSEEEPTKG